MSSNNANKPTKPLTKSFEEMLQQTENEWSALGLSDVAVNKEVFRKWMDTKGYQLVLINLHKLAATDSKGFLTAAATWNEFISAKITRTEGGNKQGTVINFSMPALLPEGQPTIQISQSHDQDIKPVEIYIEDRSKNVTPDTDSTATNPSRIQQSQSGSPE